MVLPARLRARPKRLPTILAVSITGLGAVAAVGSLVVLASSLGDQGPQPPSFHSHAMGLLDPDGGLDGAGVTSVDADVSTATSALEAALATTETVAEQTSTTVESTTTTGGDRDNGAGTVEPVSTAGAPNPTTTMVPVTNQAQAASTAGFQLLAVTPSRSFSPNGDDFEDVLRIETAYSVPVSMMAHVLDGNGRQVATASVTGPDESGPVVLWDGVDDDGRHLGEGLYDIRLVATGPDERTLETIIATEVDRAPVPSLVRPLDGRSVTGKVDLAVAAAQWLGSGDRTLTIATTSGLGDGYEAVLADGPEDDGVWRGSLNTAYLTNGDHELQLTATWTDRFGAVHRYRANTSEFIVKNGPRLTDDWFDIDVGAVLDLPAPGVLQNDTHPTDRKLIVDGFGDPEVGTLEIDPTGAVRFEPPANWSGIVSVPYSVSDTAGNRAQAELVISVKPPNRAPEFENVEGIGTTIDYSDGTGPISLAVSDSDGGSLTFKLVPSSPELTATLGTARCETGFGPTRCRLAMSVKADGAAGPASVTVQATDRTGDSATLTVPVEVVHEQAEVEIIDVSIDRVTDTIVVEARVEEVESEGEVGSGTSAAGRLNRAQVDAELQNDGPVRCDKTVSGTGYDQVLTARCVMPAKGGGPKRLTVSVVGDFYRGSTTSDINLN